ncbi:hypothetical protein [Vineibacter terrae]|uniref:hypothetical protein n=1 Tax=Vineibacter terrae TaxID=2586908 RepID=UPI0015B39E72|nr:hypothetical protein [Vineibacter terrae]
MAHDGEWTIGRTHDTGKPEHICFRQNKSWGHRINESACHITSRQPPTSRI